MPLEENFDFKIIEKIKTEHLKPKPRWQFLLKDYTIWTLGILAWIFGSVAMSLIFYMLRYSDVKMYQRLEGASWEKMFLLFPFFWLIFLIIFVFAVLYNFKHTQTGYRYSATLIVSVVVGASLIFGGSLYFFGLSQGIIDVLGRRAPLYDRLINPHIDFWSQPESGRLTGLIINQTATEQYQLVDRDHNIWTISIINNPSTTLPLEIGRPMRFIGQQQDDDQFIVTEIISSNPPDREFFRRINNDAIQFQPPKPQNP